MANLVALRTVQDAADSLKEIAKGRLGYHQIQEIEKVGACDEQSKARIYFYCMALGISLDPFSKWIEEGYQPDPLIRAEE